MNAHTPGPWKFETVRTSCGICHKIGEFQRGNKITYACVYDDYGSPDNPDSKALLANARLMASAPDLLEALCEFMAEHAIPSSICTERPAYEKAIAAIAKAVGEAP